VWEGFPVKLGICFLLATGMGFSLMACRPRGSIRSGAAAPVTAEEERVYHPGDLDATGRLVF